MPAPFTVLVQVRGGVVVDVSSTDDDNIQVIVFDWDDADADDEYPDSDTLETLRLVAPEFPAVDMLLDELGIP